MKNNKVEWLMVFTGILLTLSFVVLGNALTEEIFRMNGDYSMQKVLVSVKNQINGQDSNFLIEDINNFEKEIGADDFCYIARPGLAGTSVSVSKTILPVSLAGITSEYTKFRHLEMADGSFITKKHEDEGALVAVIDEELAGELFKTVTAVGNKIEIYGSEFKIAGVVKKENTLIGKFTDDGLPDVYIPAEVMLELDAAAKIAELQVKSASAGTLNQNISGILAVLRKIGKNPSNYEITDFNLRFASMVQKPLILVFILGMASMLTLLVYIKNLIKELYIFIKHKCRTDYLSAVIKNNFSEIGICLLEIAVSVFGIVLIWLGIRFRLYIHPNYIPEELIDVSYYTDLVKGVIQGSIRNMGYIMPYAGLTVNTADRIMDMLFFISAVPGLIILYSSFRNINYFNRSLIYLTLIFGLMFVLSLGILAFTAILSGLPGVMNVKGILVIWSFIYLKILFNTKRKESDYYV